MTGDRYIMKPDNMSSIRELFEGKEMTSVFYNTRKSAVIVPLIEVDGKVSILFEVRSRDIIQGGEVCFPGGVIEDGETSLEAAVRETGEELLVDEEDIEIISPLFSIQGPSGMEVKSYLGYLRNYEYTFSENEVDHVFSVELDWFLNNMPLVYDTKMEVVLPDDYPFELIPGGRDYPFRANPRRFYFYRVKGEVIWGLTGNILHNFISYIEDRM